MLKTNSSGKVLTSTKESLFENDLSFSLGTPDSCEDTEECGYSYTNNFENKPFELVNLNHKYSNNNYNLNDFNCNNVPINPERKCFNNGYFNIGDECDINNINYQKNDIVESNIFKGFSNSTIIPSMNNFIKRKNQTTNPKPNKMRMNGFLLRADFDMTCDPYKCLRDLERDIDFKQKIDDPSNRIVLLNIIKQRDPRTTIMIRNIPNKYTLKTILEEINSKFAGKYDLFYLPIDFKNGCNLGYAFINFTNSFHVLYFYEQFRGKKWNRFNSDKLCELAYAKFQGKKQLVEHFERGYVMKYETDEKKPLILNTETQKIELPLVSQFY